MYQKQNFHSMKCAIYKQFFNQSEVIDDIHVIHSCYNLLIILEDQRCKMLKVRVASSIKEKGSNVGQKCKIKEQTEWKQAS